MKRVFLLLLIIWACESISASRRDSIRVTFFGDSYTTYEGYLTPDTNEVWYFRPPRQQNGNDVSRVEETWWWQVKENLGWKVDRVNAYSGSTVCFTGYRNEDYTPRSFVTRMSNLGEPDVILVCAATNDSWCGAPIGEYKYGEWTREELFCFRPAMAKMCWGLRTHYPKSKVLFILNSELKESINESVRTICKHYDIPVLELQNVDKQKGHPSVAGMKSIADQVCKWIREHKYDR